MKLQNENFANETEAGGASNLVNADRIWVTANSINKTLHTAIDDDTLGGTATPVQITNSTINTYDLSDVSTNSYICHQATGACTYLLPSTSIAEKKLIFVHDGPVSSSGTTVTVDTSNNKIDFNRSGDYTATLNSGTYHHGSSGVSGTLGSEIKARMEAADTGSTYTVSFDSGEKFYTISCNNNFYFKFGTGGNQAASARKLIGFLAMDGSSATSHTGLSVMNEMRIQPASGHKILFSGGVAENPGYLALRRRGVMVVLAAVDSTTWVAETVAMTDHFKNTTIGTQRDVSLFGRDTWVEKISAGAPRPAFASNATNGYSYFTCGRVGSWLTAENDQYNQHTNTFVTKQSCPSEFGDGTGWSLNGIAWSSGGWNNSVYLTSNYAYNSVTNTWSSGGGLPEGRGNSCSYVLNGYGFVNYGYSGAVRNTYFKYNVSTNSFSTVTTGGTARESLGGFPVGGYGYSYMGLGSSENSKYNDSANVITTATSTPASSAAVNGSMLSGMGHNCSNTAMKSYIYLDTANLWLTKTPPTYVGGSSTSLFGYLNLYCSRTGANTLIQYN